MKISRLLFMLALPMVVLAACSEKSDGELKDTGQFEKAYLQFDSEISEEDHTGLFAFLLYNGEFIVNEQPTAPFDGLMLALFSDSSKSVPDDGTYMVNDTQAKGTIYADNSHEASMYVVAENNELIFTDVTNGSIKWSHKDDVYTIQFDITLDGGEKLKGVYVGPLQVETPKK